MALYVRIAVNLGDVGDVKAININDPRALRLEDAYPEYQGCRECGFPLEPARSDDSYKQEEPTLLGWSYVPGPGGCPQCHEGAPEIDEDDPEYEYPDSTVYLAPHNPRAELGEDGSLSVMRGGYRLGFYPPGAWVSYRSD